MNHDHDDLYAAKEYLVSVGELSECEEHSTVYGGGSELSPAFFRQIEIDKDKRAILSWTLSMKPADYREIFIEAYNAFGGGGTCSHCAHINSRDF